MNTNDINKMSISERFQMMELLWDSFSSDQSQIEPPGWHENIIQERKDKIESKTAKFIPLDALKAKRE